MQKTSLHNNWIDPHGVAIIQSLQKAGFTSYFVGGCVRDLLVGIHPKDFDIATSAYPPQVRRIVPGARVIGKRFRLVLVFRGDMQFEVATFRREPLPDEVDEEGEPLQSDNLFGDPEQDANRRDFTINAIFYDPVSKNVIDYCSGLDDIESRMIRTIGIPEVRIKEDPIRTLRAIRLTHKLHFSIESSFRQAIFANAVELKRSVLPRRREEFLKILRLADPMRCLLECFDLDILQNIFPALHQLFSVPEKLQVFESYMNGYSQAVQDPSNPIELFSLLLLAFYRANTFEDHNPELLQQTIVSKDFLTFLKDELGVFNAEQAILIRSLQNQASLLDSEKWKTRGPRRLISFVKSDAFPYSLQMAEKDYVLDAQQIFFWRKLYRDTVLK